ncbi:MAG: DNA polymerase IV [Candidatus Aenigmarchaeota archaeon]|nr:DNA polymerase IV [Candidatus Aenigmarchaeota archaeon]
MSIIFHIDMDAFFAACEEHNNPELKGKPVVIGAAPKEGKGRGVVSTASYEARKYGIHSALPISKAYKLCPTAVFLPVNMKLYIDTSFRVMQIIRKYASAFQQASVDEAFIIPVNDEVEKIAKQIKQEIKEKEGLTCSIGIAPNKSIAKIASDYKKPDGLTIVTEEEAKSFLAPMSVRKLQGVGPKTESLLNTLGIKTIGDLAKYDQKYLEQQLGKWGTYLHILSQGHGSTEVYEEEGIQSISREYTFDEDTNDAIVLSEIIDELSTYLHAALIESGYSFKTVAVKIRYSNFETHTKQISLQQPSLSREVIAETAKLLLNYFTQSKKKIRLIGVKLSNLSTSSKQKSIKEYTSLK